MSSTPGYQATDPIVSSNFSLYSPSVSRARTSRQLLEADMLPSHSAVSESDPLLSGRHGQTKKPFYRPRPLWLVPFAIVASIVRGMTLAPRVQVFTQLSCNAIYGHDIYDHTGSNTTLTPDYPHFPFHVGLVGRQLEILDLDLPASGEGSVYVATQSRHLNINHIDEEGDDDDDDDDPRLPPSKRCLQDSAVQAGAARIQTIMTVTMGTLSALTTGWWGHFGERHGRTRVLAAATFGLFLTDLTFILVSTPHSIFAAHGHKLLIISPIIEGLLGGWSTLQGATSAYVSDCTSDGSRAHIFSRFTGVFYFGFAIGPTIGAFLIRHPFLPIFSSSSGSLHNGAPTVTSVFYIAAMASFVNMLLVLFLFPESLEKKKAKVSQQLQLAVSEESSPSSADRHSFLTDFLSPLALFLPRKIEVPGGTSRKDWSLTILAIALFGYLLSTGIFQIKYLYAQHVYGWGAEQLSYYISFMGVARALHLLLILPFLIATFKPKPKIVSHPVPGPSSVNTTRAVQPIKKGKRSPTVLAKEMRYDLLLIRASFIVDLLSHTLVSLSPADASQTLFVGFTVLSSFGAGIVPAANSLALCVMQSHGDGGIGKLFGAFAVLQAVGQMILGPMLFGLIFSETVAKFPKAIFMTAAGFLFLSIVVLCFLRPDAVIRTRQQAARLRAVDMEVERGRPRASKDISRSSFTVPIHTGAET